MIGIPSPKNVWLPVEPSSDNLSHTCFIELLGHYEGKWAHHLFLHGGFNGSLWPVTV
jgi:hypothetical protein